MVGARVAGRDIETDVVISTLPVNRLADLVTGFNAMAARLGISRASLYVLLKRHRLKEGNDDER